MRIQEQYNYPPSNNSRVVGIDVLKGIGIILVVFYHILYDLCDFGYLDLDATIYPHKAWAHLGASIFVVLSGTSLFMSLGKPNIWPRLFKRSLKLFVLASIISLVTYYTLGYWGILFGLLHFMAVVPIFIAPVILYVKPHENVLLLLSALIFLATPYINQIEVSHWWFMVLGIVPNSWIYIDFFPLFPWLGAYLIGIVIGLNQHKQGIIFMCWYSISPDSLVTRCLTFLGRHTLGIYLFHQPILYVLFYIIK